MKLKALLEYVHYTCLCGSLDVEISSLSYNTKEIEPGALFVCIAGTKFDAHSVFDMIAASGAYAVVVNDTFCLPDGFCLDNSIAVIAVSDTRAALALISRAYFGCPDERLTTIGITGTKGKTTTAYLIRALLEDAGIKTGLIGTIETIIGEHHIKASNTTPESYQIYQYFADMLNSGIQSVVMEVSSQGLMMSRTAGITFDIGVFTNLSPDHISPLEHRDFEEYAHCKSLLFKQCRIGIGNADDPHYDKMFDNAACKKFQYGISEKKTQNTAYDLYAKDVSFLRTSDGRPGMGFSLFGNIDNMEGHIEVGLPGLFSVYNALCALSVGAQLKLRFETMKETVAAFQVKGRIEAVDVPGDFFVLIDYAHNAIALESLLLTLKKYEPKRLVCLFGCGGDRAKDRRYEMGRVSGELADFTIITSDNPRTEKPEDIIADIRSSIEKTGGSFIEIVDRREAIKYALDHAKSGDIIALCGKGHEDYQEINGKKYHMDEREIIAEIVCQSTRK